MKKRPNAKEKLTALDLFCGAGGLTLGLKRAGIDVLAGIELDSVAAATYTANHREVLCLNKDIKSVSPEELMKKLGLQKGQLSLLAGCPPCQGFSSLRTKNKSTFIYDQRNDLLFQYLRFVRVFFPHAVMMENVPTLAKDKRMSHFIAGLKKLGYTISKDSIRIEDAADYGVPQRRKRMILLVTRTGTLDKPLKQKTVTVREHFKKNSLPAVGTSKDVLHDFIANRSPRVMAIIKAIPKDGGSRSDLPKNLILKCHQKPGIGFSDIYGRMKWDSVAPTITSGCSNPSKGRFLHPEEDRAITLREAALLQTFPKSYKFPLSKNREKIALMIGNALPPEFIRRHALMIKKALQPKAKA